MCDKELIGRVFKEGKLELDLKKYASFYKGTLMSEAKAEKLLTGDEIESANVVGERSVNIMLKKALVAKSNVKKIKNIPFVHVYKVDIG